MTHETVPLAFPLFPLSLAVLVLMLFGIGFNQLVKWKNERKLWPVSLDVAFGVTVTLVVPGMFFLRHEMEFWQTALIYFLCFAASGTPMIFGNVHRDAVESHKARPLPNRAMHVRDDVVMEIKKIIEQVVDKNMDVADLVRRLYEVVGSLKSL